MASRTLGRILRAQQLGVMMAPLHVNHVLSSPALRSTIFDDLIRRVAAAAPVGTCITRSVRPDGASDVWHYHRPNLEFRLRQRAVVTVHHDLRETERWLRLKAFLPRYREARFVHCLNQQQRAILAEHGILNTVVIPHGVDRTVFPAPGAARPPRQDGRLFIGMASRRYARGVKGEALLESLLAALPPDRVSLIFAGEDRWMSADHARQAGFTADCFDRLPYPLFGQFYDRLDLLLILSDFEGGPASLPEALGYGVPVAATPVGMVPDMIEDGRNGLILTRNVGEDAARVLALLDNDGAGLRHLLAGAAATADAVPSWPAVMGRLHALYREAVD